MFSLDEFPDVASKYRATAFHSVGGGPAATAAVAIARLGGTVQLATRIGHDDVGEIVVNELEGHGVDCSLVRRFSGSRTSVSTVLVDRSGERLIVNFLDPQLENQPDWLPDELPSDVDAVLCDTLWPEGALHMLGLARSRGVPGVLDADLPVPADVELLRSASHVAFSQAGLADYCGEADPDIGLSSVAANIDAWCCVTLGAKGAISIDNGEKTLVEAFDVPVSDTLGAGDVWHGAFALALAERADVIDAMRFAAAAAALKVATGGGRSGCPDRQAVEEFLSQQEQGTG